MKKLITSILLVFALGTAYAWQTPPPAAPTEPQTGKTKSSSAIWIGLGVVLFVTIIAARNRRRRN